MKGRSGNFLDAIRASYWLIPTLMTVAAAIIAFVFIQVEKASFADTLWLYSGGPDGAREILSSIAGSMITVTGVVFSVTIVAFTLASQQFGPRILRNFVRDRSSQTVLGTFIATYIYCLIVLRSIRNTDGEVFVPALALTISLILTLCSVGLLIFYIHHVSSSIRVTAIIAAVGRDLESAVDRLFPGEQESIEPADGQLPRQDAFGVVKAKKTGYVQVIGKDALLELATEHDLLIETVPVPGAFVIEGADLAKIWPAEKYADVAEKIRSALVLGKERTPTQDIITVINQLAQVAVRALSPGINDPRTAITCIHFLAVPICKIAERPRPVDRCCDKKGRLRLIFKMPSFADVTTATFDQIRPYAQNNSIVICEMLKMIEIIAQHAARAEDRVLLYAEAVAIRETFRSTNPQSRDRRRLQEYFTAAVDRLKPISAAGTGHRRRKFVGHI